MVFHLSGGEGNTRPLFQNEYMTENFEAEDVRVTI